MDFSKFMGLLTDGGLYFSRADLLGDPFEGARGNASRRDEWMKRNLNYLKEMVRTRPTGYGAPLEDEVERQAMRLQNEIEARGKRDVEHTYVTCWHSNEGESEALWRLYCPPGTAGVCISTNFKALDEALVAEEEIRFGHVQYVDFSKAFAGTYDRIFWKRKSLSHEAEVRGVIQRHFENEEGLSGVLVKADPAKLIQTLIVSPFAPPWFEKVLKETIAKMGLSITIKRSELNEEPFF
jgi:hypothetical protein